MESNDSSNIQQSSLLEQLVECSPNGIIVVDMNQVVEIVNPTTKTLLPLINDPIGMPLKDVFPVPPLLKILYSWRQLIEQFNSGVIFNSKSNLIQVPGMLRVEVIISS